MALQKRFVLPPPPNPDDDINGYSWRDWFRQLRDYLVHAGTILWSQIDFTGSKLSDLVNRPHNVLQSMQGGDSLLNEYYHLSKDQYDNLTTTKIEVQVATANQTVFTLTTITYVPGSKTLSIFVDGLNQILGITQAYTETSSTQVTFTEGLHVGAKVKFVVS